MTRRGALVGAVAAGVLMLGACSSDPPSSPEVTACQEWMSAVDREASFAEFHAIADRSQGAVRPAMEAVRAAMVASMDRTGTDDQIVAAFGVVAVQCAQLGVSA